METSIEAIGLKNACALFLKDLEALPEDAFCKSFGHTTRSVADIVYEVNLVNDHVGMAIRDEEQFEWRNDGWIKAPAEFCSKDQIVDAFKKSSQKIVETAESFTPEQLAEKFTTNGKETTRAERCRFMTVHIWYHCGQLNFIQTLLGDTDWHWK